MNKLIGLALFQPQRTTVCVTIIFV